MSYFYNWKLKLNPHKSELINFNKNKAIPNLKIVNLNNIPIAKVKTITYLGVYPKRILTFKKEVNSIIKKASGQFGLLIDS